MKNNLMKLRTTLFPCYMADGSAIGGGSKGKINLELTENNKDNYVSLKWNSPDASSRHSYMVYAKKSYQDVFQSTPAKENVKVLNIYPGIGNNLKRWMEEPNEENSSGYGKGLIHVDEVDIDVFKSDSKKYMKDENNEWRYDAIYIGAWDSNNNKDLTSESAELIKTFIEEGRGVIVGHDTLNGFNPFLCTLSQYANIECAQPKYRMYGDSNLVITKKGILTNYPWNIGDVGTELAVPLSHTYNQFAMGDVWMKYKKDVWGSPEEITESDGRKGTNNFYLTTWNNVSMIQAGHSNGVATPDEQKVIANLLFYMSQVTEETSWNDHSGQDIDAPNIPSVKGVSYNDGKNSITINYTSGEDNGTSYDYYVEATNLQTKEKVKSEVKTVTVKVGIKGYMIVIDNNSDTVPSGDITTSAENFDLSLDGIKEENAYVHIACVDNAGNISNICHYKLDLSTLIKTDVNKDGEFTLLDLAIVGRHYGENPKDSTAYNTDIVKNGIVDDADLDKVAENIVNNKNYEFNN